MLLKQRTRISMVVEFDECIEIDEQILADFKEEMGFDVLDENGNLTKEVIEREEKYGVADRMSDLEMAFDCKVIDAKLIETKIVED